MRRPITITIFVLLMQSAQILPQQTAPGAVEGIVVQAATGSPVAGAQVRLTVVNGNSGSGIFLGPPDTVINEPSLAVSPVGQFSPPAGIPPVTTGSDGKFSFKQLTAGTYRVAATANGYVRQEYGQVVVTGLGSPLYLKAGEALKDVAIRLVSTGTLSGRLFNENGEPATGAPVQLLRVQYRSVGKFYEEVGAVHADDRGQYRLYGVLPGRYVLSAGNPPAGPSWRSGPGGGPPSPGASRYEPFYHPGVADIEQATPIEINGGRELTIDIRLTRQSQTFSVRGHVIDSETGAPPPRVRVAMRFRDIRRGTFSQVQTYDPATGAFELRSIPPGDYWVEAQVQETPPAGAPLVLAVEPRLRVQIMWPFARSLVRVVDSDVEGIVLALTPGVIVDGKIQLEGGQISSIGNLARIWIVLNSMTHSTDPFTTPPNPDGTFQIQGMREGEFRFTSPVMLAGYYVKSIRYGGQDIYTKPFQFSGSSSGTVEVVLRADVAQVSGTVTNAQSRTVSGIQVALIPVGNVRPEIRVANTDQDGHYSIANVPPGDYRVFSWESMNSGSYYDPDFVKQYEQQGALVHLEESSNQNVDVKIIPAQK